MINNYLRYVKTERKSSIQAAIADQRKARGLSNEWLQGFYLGWSGANYCQALRWRRLQKDIEARLADPQAAVLPLANLILTHPIFKS